MNRAQRRQAKRLGIKGETIPTLTVDNYIHIYTLSIALALDSVEIGKEKALEIMAKIEENADCMLHNYINQDDVEKMCADVYGIEFLERVRKHKVFVNNDGSLVTT